MRFSIFVLLFSVSALFGFEFNTNHKCIQISTNSLKMSALQSYNVLVKEYPDVRVEQIGKWFIVRALYGKNNKDIIVDYRKLKKRFPDAYLRTCSIEKDNLIASHVPANISSTHPSLKDAPPKPKNKKAVAKKSISKPKQIKNKKPKRPEKHPEKHTDKSGQSLKKYNETALRDSTSQVYVSVKNYDDVSIFKNKSEADPKSSDEANLTSMLSRLESNNRDYLNLLESKDPFYGLYVKGKYDQFSKTFSDIKGANKYEAQLRWEIFNDGYFENIKKVDKKINSSKIQYLQLLNNMVTYDYDSKIFEAKLYMNEINLVYHLNMIKMYKELFEKRKVLLDMSVISIEDVQRLSMKINYHSVYVDHYSDQERKKIDKSLYNFLNTVEYTSLINKEKFFEHVKENDVSLKLQNEFKNRADYFPEFSDNLKASVYATHTKQDTRGAQDSFGIQVDIPVQSFNGEAKRVAELEKGQYDIQKSAITLRLKQKISYLYMQFDYTNAQIKASKEELKFLYHRRANIMKRTQYELLDDGSDLARIAEVNQIEIFDLKYGIIKLRMKNYLNFIDLYKISGYENMYSMIDDDITYNY